MTLRNNTASGAISAARKSAAGEGVGTGAEWAVVTGSYPPYAAVGPIGKQTAQRVYHPATYNPQRTAFSELSAVLYRGTAEDCAKLAERALSSRALHLQERRASLERHEARVAALFAAAEGSDAEVVGEATPSLAGSGSSNTIPPEAS